MSSGNYAGRSGFSESGKPNGTPACGSQPEPRGPAVFLAGLCATCGRATIHRDDAGLPRHRLHTTAGTP